MHEARQKEIECSYKINIFKDLWKGEAGSPRLEAYSVLQGYECITSGQASPECNYNQPIIWASAAPGARAVNGLLRTSVIGIFLVPRAGV